MVWIDHVCTWIAAISKENEVLKIVGGIVVYGFAMFGLGVYLQRVMGRA